MSKKELEVKQESNVPAIGAADWGITAPQSSSDIEIARLLLMQKMSKLVDSEEASPGQFIDSLTNEVIADKEEEFEIIPFHVEKVWEVHAEETPNSGKFKWKRFEPIIESPMASGYNDKLPWQDTEGGVSIRRVRRLNFYVLLPKQIAEGTSLPFLLSFRSMSYKMGVKLNTQMYMRNIRAGLSPAGYVVKVKSLKQDNDKGSWYIPSISLGRKSTNEEVMEAKSWFDMVGKGKVRVHEADEEGFSSSEASEGIEADAHVLNKDVSGPGKF